MKTHCWTCLRQACPAPLPCLACPVVFCSVACKPAAEQHRSVNSYQCCGSASAFEWIHYILVSRILIRIRICIKKNPDPHSDPHRSDKLNPEQCSSGSALICKWQAKMYGILAFFSTFSRVLAFVWEAGSGSGSESASGWKVRSRSTSGSHPDPHQIKIRIWIRIRMWIHTKVMRIHNTDY